MFPSEVSTKLT